MEKLEIFFDMDQIEMLGYLGMCFDNDTIISYYDKLKHDPYLPLSLTEDELNELRYTVSKDERFLKLKLKFK